MDKKPEKLKTPIKLRPHHLLCILTHVGKGYSDAFVQNMGRVIQDINDGATITIVRGPDDICAACSITTVDDYHCQNDDKHTCDLDALRDLSALFDKSFDYGMDIDLTPATLKIMRGAFVVGKIRTACEGCEWFDLCAEIAGNHFSKTRLR